MSNRRPWTPDWLRATGTRLRTPRARVRPSRPVPTLLVADLSARLGVTTPSRGPDRILCGAALTLTCLGVVMVFSAGSAFAAKTYGDWTYFLKREVIYALIGLGAFAFALRTDYSVYRRFTYPLLLTSLTLLAAVRFFGTEVNGATRWFRVGPISFQPSELAKFALVLYLAMLLARKAEKVRDFSIGFLPPLIVTGCFLGLLLLQKDLGTSVILGVVALGLLFVAGTRTSYILGSLLLVAPLVWKFVIMGESYRMRRLMAFLDPFLYRQREGYQLYESLISVGSGGLFGQGLGKGRQKLFFLPEAHTDFILAIVGEELGLAGVAAILLGFALLVWRGFRAASRARDLFGSYLALGISLVIGLQVFVNMGVVLGILPTKGLPLPFISYGGTSLVTMLFMTGVLANVSARNPEPRPVSLWELLRLRASGLRNRRSEPGARIVVEVGRKRRLTASTPVEALK